MKIKKLFPVLLSLLLVASNTTLKAANDDDPENTMAISYHDGKGNECIKYFGSDIIGFTFSQVIDYITKQDKEANTFWIMSISPTSGTSYAIRNFKLSEQNKGEQVKEEHFFHWKGDENFNTANAQGGKLENASKTEHTIVVTLDDINGNDYNDDHDEKKSKWYWYSRVTDNPITTAIVLALLAIGMALFYKFFITSKKKKNIEAIEEVEL